MGTGRENLKELSRELNMINWNQIEGMNVEEGLDILTLKVVDAYNKSCPMIQHKLNRNKERINAWISSDLLEKRKKLQNLARKSRLGSVVNKAIYKLEKRLYKESINCAKQNHLAKLIKDNEGDNKKIWNILKDLTGSKAENFEINSMEIGGNLTNDQQKIADNFSTYYKNIAMDLGNNIISGQDDHK